MASIPRNEALTAVMSGIAEWLFAMLPLVVVAIVTSQLGEVGKLLSSVEWSFGAAILSAQSLIRFVQGALTIRKLSVERVLFVLALLLVLIVVPVNIVLVFVLSSELQHGDLGAGLIATQIGFFILASVLFIVTATTGNLWQRSRITLGHDSQAE